MTKASLLHRRRPRRGGGMGRTHPSWPLDLIVRSPWDSRDLAALCQAQRADICQPWPKRSVGRGRGGITMPTP